MTNKMKSERNYNNYVRNEYTKLTSQLSELMNKCPEYSVETKNDGHDNKILNVYCNDKKILSAKYEILGTYDFQNNLFFWAKNMYIVDKQSIVLSKQIMKFSAEIKEMIIKKKYDDIQYLEKILYYVKNNIFFILPENLHNLLEFSVTTTKCKGIVSQKHEHNGGGKITYVHYLVTDILGT